MSPTAATQAALIKSSNSSVSSLQSKESNDIGSSNDSSSDGSKGDNSIKRKKGQNPLLALTALNKKIERARPSLQLSIDEDTKIDELYTVENQQMRRGVLAMKRE